MTIALWVVQALLAASFLPAGVLHGFQYERARAQLKWPAAVPRGLMTFIGVSEILGAVGLILPAVTGVLPWLTPMAALVHDHATLSGIMRCGSWEQPT
jgi:uncharacterized membrane protein